MNSKQLARLEQLDGMEFMTSDEEAEHRHLLRLQSEMRQAFEKLREQGMRPTWVGGEYIIANPREGVTKIVRGLPEALRLISA